MLVRLDALGQGKRNHKRVTGILSPRPPRQELFREIDPVYMKACNLCYWRGRKGCLFGCML